MKKLSHVSMVLGVALALLGLNGCTVTVTTDESPERSHSSEGYVHESTVEWLTSPEFAEMNLPFSQAVQAGNLLFLSGEIGIVPGSGKLISGGIGPETSQTLENIRMTLEKFGSSMNRVVKCTVFLASMGEWGAMNDVYKEFFENPPARSALGANGLALNARVEIECIAAL